jgi:hypothetical protein
VGALLLVLAWFVGPGLFGTAEAEEGTKTEATVTAPAECSAPAPRENVRFELGGKAQDGLLDACGHDRDEHVSILVPPNPGSGVVVVSSAKVIEGHSDALRPIGLLLLAASCAVGGIYAFLFLRGPRSKTRTP